MVTKRSSKHPWHAVAIVPRADACEPAVAIRGKRFLSPDAPSLPLQDCPNPSACKCVYQHHEDRRTGPRRASELSGLRTARPQQNRRAGPGRRKRDGE
jgi:hypothetical protein